MTAISSNPVNHRKSILFIIILWFVVVSSPISIFSKNDSVNDTYDVAVVYLHGEVDYALARFTERSINDAKEHGVKTIIFDIDTFGGRVDSALDISHAITTATSFLTVGYVTVKAISAGALITLSCDKIVMRSGTTIGDCAPISVTNQGAKMLGEKFQSPLRAEFRKLARRNGYPFALAEAMVSSDTEVLKVIYTDGYYNYMTRKEFNELADDEKGSVYKTITIVDKGQLLTMHDQEALEYGFASAVLDNETEIFNFLKLKNPRVMYIRFLWSEKLVKLLNKIAPFLILIGLLALYTEFKVPGFGLPGIVGITCFVILFVSKYLIGLADYIDIILFMVGILLLFLEVFVIPGFGITGLLGITCLLLSLYLSSQSFVIPRFPWEIKLAKDWITQLGIILIVFFVSSFILARFLPKSSLAKRIMLQTTLADQAVQPVTKDYTHYLNKEGIALSILRPTGRAQIGEDVLNVISDSGFISKGEAIKVIRIESTKIFVQQV